MFTCDETRSTGAVKSIPGVSRGNYASALPTELLNPKIETRLELVTSRLQVEVSRRTVAGKI